LLKAQCGNHGHDAHRAEEKHVSSIAGGSQETSEDDDVYDGYEAAKHYPSKGKSPSPKEGSQPAMELIDDPVGTRGVFLQTDLLNSLGFHGLRIQRSPQKNDCMPRKAQVGGYGPLQRFGPKTW
jgi:hypothetical protein